MRAVAPRGAQVVAREVEPVGVDLPGLPAPGLVAAATRDTDYKRWTRDFLGGGS